MNTVTIMLKNGNTVTDKVSDDNYQNLMDRWSAFLGGHTKGKQIGLEGIRYHAAFDGDSIAAILAE